jgi:antirestriction protein ArdC
MKSVDDGGEEVKKEIRFLKIYTVVNIDQIDGAPKRFYAPPAEDGLSESQELLRHFCASPLSHYWPSS